MDYDVALSFAGEDREYVEAVAIELKNRGVKVFYDRFEKVDLWGKNQYTHFRNIYESGAKYVVIFISKYYAGKKWPNHELTSAQARAIREPSEYILPARFDDTNIEGLLPTVAYIDLRECSPVDLAVIIQSKLEFEFGTSQGKGPNSKNQVDLPQNGSGNLQTGMPLSLPPASRRDRTTRSDMVLPFEVPDNVRGLHTDAHRFARLLVSEIHLYNKAAVEKGRQFGDLYERLYEAINRSRNMYNKRYGQNAVLNYDYFHHELVNSLAHGDFSKLGLIQGIPDKRLRNQSEHSWKEKIYLSTGGDREHQYR